MVTIRRLHEAAYQPVPVLQKEPNGILQGPSIDLTMRRGFYTIVTPEGDCMKEPSLAASGHWLCTQPGVLEDATFGSPAGQGLGFEGYLEDQGTY